MKSVSRWYTEFSHLSPECRELLKKFSMVQQELARELLAAKPLGICKISIYGINESNSRNPILTLTNGKNNTIFDTFGRNGSKETF